jgi:hypothetical protein
MRPYANWMLVVLLNCSDKEELNENTKIVNKLIKVANEGDHLLGKSLKSKDFGENTDTRAKFWVKRL